MSEYLYTDLPRYVKTTPRENFANSVVKSGSVLLFSEDGENLVAKLPDGSFTEIGGGSAEYYRCASVDTSSHTWTGYKAVLNGGVYTFENTVTQGLVYASITPVIGNIYSADALVKVSNIYTGNTIPTDGLVFYAPLKENKETAETGQGITNYGNPVFEISDGRRCVLFNGENYIATNNPASSVFTGFTTEISYGCWLKTTMPSGSENLRAFSCTESNKGFSIQIKPDITYSAIALNSIWYTPTFFNTADYVDKWVFLLAVYDATGVKLYINTDLVTTSSEIGGADILFPDYSFVIGAEPYPSIIKDCFRGYISDVIIYNKALSHTEIINLYNATLE